MDTYEVELEAAEPELELAKLLPLHEFLVRADAIKHHAALERSTRVCGARVHHLDWKVADQRAPFALQEDAVTTDVFAGGPSRSERSRPLGCPPGSQ